MNYNKIHLIGNGRTDEAVAAAAITPGHLVKQNTVGKLIKHDTEGGYAEAAFAVEDALQGKTIDDAYVTNAQAFFVLPGKGDVVYAFLEAGESVTPADFLTSAGNGNLQKAASTNVRLAVPLDVTDNSETDAVAVRIRVRIL